MEPGVSKKGTSPWIYVGCGCAALVILGMAGIAGVTWITYREGKKLEKAWSDPAAAESRTRGVLTYEELPEGYHPLGSFSLPFVMDMALIGDDPPPPGSTPDSRDNGGFKERGFIYIKLRRFGNSGQEMRDYLEGKGKQPEWMKGGTEVDTTEVLKRGTVEANGQKIVFSANRGEVNQGRRSVDGIATILMIDCPRKDRIRFGIWFAPDPEPETPAAELDLTGTNADPEEIRKFASHFRFCEAGK
ncbi:MAG TPA: hypothetical protein VE078_14055 [Thermoanaerobaculia bacterium]|nr:hypothetical protein [Thermoanaerobaculia bacterium]